MVGLVLIPDVDFTVFLSDCSGSFFRFGVGFLGVRGFGLLHHRPVFFFVVNVFQVATAGHGHLLFGILSAIVV